MTTDQLTSRTIAKRQLRLLRSLTVALETRADVLPVGEVLDGLAGDVAASVDLLARRLPPTVRRECATCRS